MLFHSTSRIVRTRLHSVMKFHFESLQRYSTTHYPDYKNCYTLKTRSNNLQCQRQIARSTLDFLNLPYELNYSHPTAFCNQTLRVLTKFLNYPLYKNDYNPNESNLSPVQTFTVFYISPIHGLKRISRHRCTLHTLARKKIRGERTPPGT